jgi:hypothetical protein
MIETVNIRIITGLNKGSVKYPYHGCWMIFQVKAVIFVCLFKLEKELTVFEKSHYNYLQCLYTWKFMWLPFL